LCPIVPMVKQAIPSARLAVSFRDLRYFLECPLQGWARVMLRLREDEEKDEAKREDEPFKTERASETVLLREVFLDALGRGIRDEDPKVLVSLYDLRTQSRARRGLMPVGLFSEVERRRHLACLVDWLHTAQAGKILDAGPFEIHRFGRAAEFDHVDQLQQPIMLDVPLGGNAQPTRIELFGHTEIVSRQAPSSLTPVLRTSATHKDYLRGFFDAVVLSLLPNHQEPAEYHADVILLSAKNRDPLSRRTLRGITPERARKFLITLLGDLFGGSHAYLLPCEAVFEYLSEQTPTPLTTRIERMKDNDRHACSSRFGPVSSFKEYDPPDIEEAHSIIERRFSLFRDVGGMSG
jgi:exodeoxyribonuclease V gamma subunit